MSRRKEPIELVELKKTNHLTRAQKEQRRREQIDTGAASSEPPDYLTASQKRLYVSYAEPLIKLGIFADIDSWTLASYCIAFEQWKKLVKNVERFKIDTEDEDNIKRYKLLNIEQNRWFSECRQCANDLGLNITSRCRLAVPEVEDEPVNKFEKFLA